MELKPKQGQLQKEYDLDCKHGAKVTISAVFNYDCDEKDRDEMIKSFASKSRHFYLELARELNNMF